MKKVLGCLLVAVMMLSLAACSPEDAENLLGEIIENNGGLEEIVGDVVDNLGITSGEEGSTGSEGSGDILTEEDLEDLENALEQLEALKPEGWDENLYGMYIYDVWDEEFLPDVLPGPVEGVLPYDTTFKDYKHDVMNQNYSVGMIEYESYEDYHEYGVNFYATKEQLDQYVESIRNAGFTGGESSHPDSEWREFSFSHKDGWYLYMWFNTNNDNDGKFDGCASVSLTDNLYTRPDSIAGVKLPTVGVIAYDYTKGVSYDTYVYETGEMGYKDVEWSESFPDKNAMSWWIFFDYYGVDLEQVNAYRDQLVNDGWVLERTSEGSDGSYIKNILKKGDVYMVANWNSRSMLQIGFSDMQENIDY